MYSEFAVLAQSCGGLDEGKGFECFLMSTSQHDDLVCCLQPFISHRCTYSRPVSVKKTGKHLPSFSSWGNKIQARGCRATRSLSGFNEYESGSSRNLVWPQSHLWTLSVLLLEQQHWRRRKDGQAYWTLSDSVCTNSTILFLYVKCSNVTLKAHKGGAELSAPEADADSDQDWGKRNNLRVWTWESEREKGGGVRGGLWDIKLSLFPQIKITTLDGNENFN